ncbi:ribonuclease H-like domain-containing protein [Tanacetum coccineum]
MVTRAQVGTVKPNSCFHGHTSNIYPLPESPSVALSDPNWRDVMHDEYNVLIKNSTWVLVLKPPNVNVVQSLWLFRHKYHADGSLSRYKDCIATNGRSQQFGVYCEDTFSLVVKQATVRTDRKTVYMYQPLGFVDSQFPNHVSQLHRAHMASYNPIWTPVDSESKLGIDGDPVIDLTLYHSITGGL